MGGLCGRVRREHSAIHAGGGEGRGNQLHSNYLATSAMGCGVGFILRAKGT